MSHLEHWPVTLDQANQLVAQLHRHHDPALNHRFSIGAWSNGKLVGVAIVGRPVARQLDQWEVAEVTRLATDGTRYACSKLYAACARAAKAMGYRRIQTYILASEPGTTLVAAGWQREGQKRPDGRGWTSRQDRSTAQPTSPKVRWCKEFKPPGARIPVDLVTSRRAPSRRRVKMPAEGQGRLFDGKE